jgi:inner membrane protein
MDPVTHAVLGAACSQALLYRYDKRNAWLAGALAAMAPDLDIFIRSAQDPMMLFIYHRHFTHSLLFIPFGGFLVGFGLLLFKRSREKKKFTFLAALIGYATHCFLDACTSYGTQLFWPFSNQRIAWDWIAIVDPFFTIPIILGLIWTWIFLTRKGVITGLGVAACYLIFCIIQHERALGSAEEYAAEQQWQITRLRAIPEIGTARHFRILAFTQERLWVAEVYVPLFASGKVATLDLFPIFEPSSLPQFTPTTQQQLRDFEVFDWFTDGYMVMAHDKPLALVDARFLRGLKPLVALWGIQFMPNEPHVRHISNITMEPSS